MSDGEQEDGTGQNLSNYSIKSMTYSLASGCKNVKTVTLIIVWKILSAAVKNWTQRVCSQRNTQTVWLAGENATVMEDVETWLDGGGDGDEDR